MWLFRDSCKNSREGEEEEGEGEAGEEEEEEEEEEKDAEEFIYHWLPVTMLKC